MKRDVWLVGDGVFCEAVVTCRYAHESPSQIEALYVQALEAFPRFPMPLRSIADVGLSVVNRLPSIANLPYLAAFRML